MPAFFFVCLDHLQHGYIWVLSFEAIVRNFEQSVRGVQLGVFNVQLRGIHCLHCSQRLRNQHDAQLNSYVEHVSGFHAFFDIGFWTISPKKIWPKLIG